MKQANRRRVPPSARSTGTKKASPEPTSAQAARRTKGLLKGQRLKKTKAAQLARARQRAHRLRAAERAQWEAERPLREAEARRKLQAAEEEREAKEKRTAWVRAQPPYKPKPSEPEAPEAPEAQTNHLPVQPMSFSDRVEAAMEIILARQDEINADPDRNTARPDCVLAGLGCSEHAENLSRSREREKAGEAPLKSLSLGRIGQGWLCDRCAQDLPAGSVQAGIRSLVAEHLHKGHDAEGKFVAQRPRPRQRLHGPQRGGESARSWRSSGERNPTGLVGPGFMDEEF